MKKLSIYLLCLLIAAVAASAIDLNIQCPTSATPGSAVSCNVVLASAPTSISEYSFTVSANGLNFNSYSGFPSGYTGDYNTGGAVSAVTGGDATATSLGTISLTAGSTGTGTVTVTGVAMSDYDFNSISITVNPATISIAQGQCTPNSCTVGQCGTIGDGCDGTLDCGSCNPGYSCVSNVCTADACPNGATNPLTCTTCPANQEMISGSCQTPTTPPPSGSTIGAQIDAGLTEQEKQSTSWSASLISKIAAILSGWFSQ